MKKPNRFAVFNGIDFRALYPWSYETREQATEALGKFIEGLEPQGYYLSDSRKRIPLNELKGDEMFAGIEVVERQGHAKRFDHDFPSTQPLF